MREHELIVTIINKDFADEAMDAARKGGAKGGTILTARGTGRHEVEKLFGLTIREEKEIIFILTEKEHKNGIMHAIISATGLNSPGKGICFSLPVDNVLGASWLPDEDEENDKTDQ